MLDIAPIKALLEIFKQIFDISKGLQKSAEEDFDKSIGTLLTDLNTTVKAYFLLFDNLNTNIRKSQDLDSFNEALDISFSERSKIVIDRNRIMASIRHIREIVMTRTRNNRDEENSAKADLLEFCESVELFFMPLPSSCSLYGTVFEELDRYRTKAKDASRYDHEGLQSSAQFAVKYAMKKMEEKWTLTCTRAEKLKSHKPEVLRAIRT